MERRRNILPRFGRTFFSFRHRVVIIVLGLAIGTSSLLFTDHMAQRLRDKEQNEVALWSYAMGRMGEFDSSDPLIQQIVNNKNNIPFIVTDDQLRVEGSHLIPERIMNHPDLLREEIEKLASVNQPLEINTYNGYRFYIFYGESTLLKMLVYFPFIQLVVIAVFIVFGYITFRSSKQDEQNRVWIGLAKETAHQLERPPRRCWGGSNTCAASRSTSRPWRR